MDGVFDLASEELLDIADWVASQLDFAKAVGSAIARSPSPDNLSAVFMFAQLGGLLGDTDGAIRVLEDNHPGRGGGGASCEYVSGSGAFG